MLYFWIGIAAVLLFIVAPAIATYLTGRKLSDISLEPISAEDPQFQADLSASRSAAAWAERGGFQFAGYFRTPGMPTVLAAWKRPEEPTYLCWYKTQAKTVCDLVTLFRDDVGLTTNDSKDAHVMPSPPGMYFQSFPGTDFDDRFRRHTSAKEFLVSGGAAALRDAGQPFQGVFCNAIRKQMAYVRGLWLWPLRALWGFYVRRHLLANLSLQQQHERKSIRLPGELLPSGTTIES